MKNRSFAVFAALPLLVFGIPVRALDATTPGPSSGHGFEPLILIGLAVMLIVAKLGGEIFQRLRQPAVLGELIGGIVLGNLALSGFMGLEPLKSNEVIAA